MKKITILLLTILPMLSFAQTFDFTNTADGWDAVTTAATLTPNSTYVAVALTEGINNPKFGTTTAGVNGATNVICAVTLQNLSASGPTFLRISYPKAAGGRVYKQQDIPAGDTSYQTYYLDLTNAEWGDATENDIQVHFKAAGNTNYTVPVGGVTVNVDKIEFIASIPTTEKNVYDFTADAEGFISVNGAITGVSGGILTFTPEADKYPKLVQNEHHVDATSFKQVHITLKNNSATNDQLRLVTPDGTRTQVITTSDSGFTTYHFDLSDAMVNPNWTGDQSFTVGIGSTVASSPGQANDTGTVEFDSILFDNTLSTVDYEIVSFSLFPNPAKNILNINSKTAIKKVEIYNIVGKQVLTANGFINSAEINVSNLNSGVYLVKISDQNNNSAIKKLILK